MGRTVGVGGSTGTTTTRSSAHTITTCSRIGEDDNENSGDDDDDNDNIYIVDIFLFLSIPKNDHNSFFFLVTKKAPTKDYALRGPFFKENQLEPIKFFCLTNDYKWIRIDKMDKNESE